MNNDKNSHEEVCAGSTSDTENSEETKVVNIRNLFEDDFDNCKSVLIIYSKI